MCACVSLCARSRARPVRCHTVSALASASVCGYMCGACSTCVCEYRTCGVVVTGETGARLRLGTEPCVRKSRLANQPVSQARPAWPVSPPPPAFALSTRVGINFTCAATRTDRWPVGLQLSEVRWWVVWREVVQLPPRLRLQVTDTDTHAHVAHTQTHRHTRAYGKRSTRPGRCQLRDWPND